MAYTRLVAAIAAREVKREYRALVLGKLNVGGTVEQPIGRHPTQRTRMAVHPGGKPAITHYRVLEKFRAHTLLRVNLDEAAAIHADVAIAMWGLALPARAFVALWYWAS